MSLGLRQRTPIVYLAFFLTLVAGPSGYAQRLETQEWDQWNAASPTIFPRENWQQYASPEEAGWSSEALADAISQLGGFAALMVVYDGAILTQQGQVERRFKCHSIRKSLLSALYGIAVSTGDIDILETIGSVGIDDDAGLTPTEKSARVSDLLKSRSGVYLSAADETRSAKESRPKRGSHKPGTHWHYNNWDFNVLATIYEKKTTDDVFEAFLTNIAEPLQMQDFELRHTHYRLEPEHSRHPAYRFRMSAQDLARFGLLFLNDGKWIDQQIVPSAWVSESTKTHSTALGRGYGFMWWVEAGQLGTLGTYAALGYGGHAVFVVPDARLVFVHRVDTYNRKMTGFTSIRNTLRQILKARVGPPHANPTLIDVPAPPPTDPGPVLTDAQLASLVGQYRQNDFVTTVSEIEGHLEVQSPRWGRFILIPRSPTEFLVEDAEWRLDFELEGVEKAKAMQIWFTSDTSLKMPRVP